LSKPKCNYRVGATYLPKENGNHATEYIINQMTT